MAAVPVDYRYPACYIIAVVDAEQTNTTDGSLNYESSYSLSQSTSACFATQGLSA